MSYKSMFALNSIVMLLAGLAFLFVPEKILLQMGTSETYVSTILAVRFLGTAMFTMGLLLWFVKDISDGSAQKGLGFAMLASIFIAFVLTLIGSVSSTSVIRSNSWILIVVYALFSLGYGFLLFLKPKMKE